jgi:hypothetical protein
MASVDQIREALKTTIEANVSGMHVYKYVPEAANVLPCVVVIPFTGDFAQAMGRGLDQWIFDLLILVSASDDQVRQAELDAYVTGAGSSSVRQAIYNNKTLGRTDCDAYVSEMTEYGMRFPVAEIEHIGARLKLIVHTTGTS